MFKFQAREKYIDREIVDERQIERFFVTKQTNLLGYFNDCPGLCGSVV